MTTVTPIGDLRELRTVYAGGGWHFQGGKRADILGDFSLGWVQVGGKPYLVMMLHMGSPPPSGSFWWKPLDDPDFPSFWEGWRQGSEKWGQVWEPAVGSLPAPHGAINVDTHTMAQMPGSWLMHWVHGVRDNVTRRYHLERAISEKIDASPDAFTRFTEDLVDGPSEECSLVLVPWRGTMELYYVRKSEERADPYGVTFRSRLYRREAPLQGYDRFPRFGPEQLVFEPAQGGQGGWGTANTTIQPGICALPDRRRLMIALGKMPFRHPNGSPAIGQMNDSNAVGAWLSEDNGLTWQPAENNPCLSRAFLGLNTPSQFGNQINSPTPWVDPTSGRVYIAVAVNRTNNVYRLGTRIMMCEIAVR